MEDPLKVTILRIIFKFIFYIKLETAETHRYVDICARTSIVYVGN